MKKFLALLPALMCTLLLRAQGTDSTGIPHPDTALGRETAAAITADSLARLRADSLRAIQLTRWRSFENVLRTHPYYSFGRKPEVLMIQPRRRADKDGLFFILLALTLYYALVHLLFPKYLHLLITLFLRATMRQQQLREQLMMMQLPALLMNFFFVLTGGLYVAFLSEYYHWAVFRNTWISWTYASSLLLVIYTGKFLLLKTAGWIFRIKAAANTYISVVFMVNKMMAIGLLPVLWLLAFPHPALLQPVLSISLVLVAGLFLYRFLISYKPVRSEIKVSPFHFFVYLCAFEIAPLLLIYKVLIKTVESSF